MSAGSIALVVIALYLVQRWRITHARERRMLESWRRYREQMAKLGIHVPEDPRDRS